MTTPALRAALDELDAFHQRFAKLFGRVEAQANGRLYLEGLLSPDIFKSVEPIALKENERHVRSLQIFVSDSPWEDAAVLAEMHRVFVEELVPSTNQWSIGTVGVIDESAFVKKGDKSAGVQRQYCGRLGKLENCQVGVYLIGVTPAGAGLLDHQLYLPVEWAKDKRRRKEAGIPQDVTFQTMPEIAATLIRRSQAAGTITLDWITADERYGNNGAWLSEQEAHGQRYVVEVPVSTTVWTADPLAAESRSVFSVADVARMAPADAWNPLSVRDGAKGPLVAEWACVRVWAVRDGQPGPAIWLLVQRSLGKRPTYKYYVSNAPDPTPWQSMALVASCRWRVEEFFGDCKGLLGMADYEVRKWRGWHHHMTLVGLAHLLVTLTRQRIDKTLPPAGAKKGVASSPCPWRFTSWSASWSTRA